MVLVVMVNSACYVFLERESFLSEYAGEELG
jgi:hypothetical protein